MYLFLSCQMYFLLSWPLLVFILLFLPRNDTSSCPSSALRRTLSLSCFYDELTEFLSVIGATSDCLVVVFLRRTDRVPVCRYVRLSRFLTCSCMVGSTFASSKCRQGDELPCNRPRLVQNLHLPIGS